MAEQQKPHVQTNENSMHRHIHMHKNSTYFNIPHVEKIGVTTRKRAPNHKQKPKRNALQTQTCGS
jgi:hypothetical protein